jgi:MYXO-CTERM domain-containing protein
VLAVTHKGKKYDGALTPAAASYLKVTEGDKLSFTMVFSDPDKDTLTASVLHTDAGGKSVGGTSFKDASGKVLKQAGDTFAGGIGSATYNWEVSQTAAKASPYELKLRVKDGEFTQEVRYVITLTAVNNAPTAPVPNAPTHKAIVATNAPSLEVLNSTDIDGDVLTYEFELYQGSSSGKPVQVKTVTEGTGGKTTLALTGLKENSWFFFRARANDGNATAGYSPWSSFSAFFVDSQNDPPTAPLLVKPADKSTLYSQNPTLSAVNPTDPDEFGNLTIFFQLAEDVGFTTGLFTSPGGVPMNQKGLSTGYKLPMWLKLAKTYYVRAYALDSKGLKGPFSNINEFKLFAKPDMGVPDASTTPDGSGTPDMPGSGGDNGLDKGNGGADGGGTPTTPGGDGDGCDCRMSDGDNSPAHLLWFLVAALLIRRRRRE